MIKVGLVNIDTSHPQAFAEYFNGGDRARYTAIFNDGFRGDDEIESFIKKAGIEKRCSTLKEVVDIVDIGFIQSCNWDKHIDQAKYFIDADKPVFIDKPIVGNLADCKRLEKYTKAGTIILGSSSVRYAEEITNFLKKPESERGKILNIFGTAGVDEFNYAVHVVEAIHQLSQSNAASVKFVGRSSIEGKICETFFIAFENGITAEYNTFTGLWQPFEVVIMTTKGTYQFRIDTTKIYKVLLDRVYDYMETGNFNFASVDRLTESVKIMLAGRISKERYGQQISIKEIPDNDPGYDGYAFEKEYGSKAGKIYL